MKTGGPDGSGLGRWPTYDRDGRAYMAFDQDGPVAGNGLRRAIRDLRGAR